MYDIELDKDGDLPTKTRHITGAEYMAQRIKIRLKTFHREWFLDRRRGLPFFTWKEQRPVDLDLISSRVRREIAQTPGVDSVRDFSARLSDSGAVLLSGRIDLSGRSARLTAELIADGAFAVNIA